MVMLLVSILTTADAQRLDWKNYVQCAAATATVMPVTYKVRHCPVLQIDLYRDAASGHFWDCVTRLCVCGRHPCSPIKVVWTDTTVLGRLWD